VLSVPFPLGGDVLFPLLPPPPSIGGCPGHPAISGLIKHGGSGSGGIIGHVQLLGGGITIGCSGLGSMHVCESGRHIG
jgi:hypothetical protein